MQDSPIIFPFIPQQITVHLGTPDSNAENVTVSYPDYLKNVASSEIYPTWNESALRANILAITSYALNRVYTEYYRSRGYDFDITNSPAYDQAYIKGRSYFTNISALVDDLFNSYIRRQGFIEPLSAKFCNGTTTVCDGLSQWGSEELAQAGADSVEILKSYYGDDIEIVNDAPIQGIADTYPGRPLQLGSSGPFVTSIQSALNEISQNYPAIPKIPAVNGVFGPETEAAVRAFQEIFALSADGIVGRSTWYAIIRIFVAVRKLAELQSLGQQQYAIVSYPSDLSLNDTGEGVRQLQYVLSVVGEFIPSIPPMNITGTYDPATRDAVVAYQQYFDFPITGTVDAAIWDSLFEQFRTIETSVFDREVLFPQNPDSSQTTRLQQFPGETLQTGTTDTKEVPMT